MPEPQPVADSVRLAWPGEASAVAAVQRRAWLDLPPELGGALLAEVDEPAMVRAWEQVLARPADARRRVLVAVAGQGRVVGFATTGPSDDPDARAGADGEVDQFWVDPPARRQGHGSRLLNACADTLRADGFARARWWVLAGDVELRRFLAVAGWEPDGASRTIGAEDGSVTLEQLRLHAGLGA
ncbi:L-amino acid N-acyltransferase YncA [Microlunatus sagamiharensis]|uniref:L-amino acid N-acyltransferase YncA n=1 Tax=Microlunatus sagamiharensis TaxID=546874 RepID=A0A1H2LV87_9ACTN|nr:GNAT family N-acetyltransferase [Microlunatus sagamiharensis]SDU84635.1 L-amino acid N-acyltransferase YncA [Microlunatus sagamiharensis]